MADILARRYRDRRTMDRYVEKGIVKTTETEAYMKALPDETNNAVYVQMDLHDEISGEDSDHHSEDA